MADILIRQWEIVIKGEHFECKYYSDDTVEVTHKTLGRKATHAGGSGPEVMARFVARGLLPGKP